MSSLSSPVTIETLVPHRGPMLLLSEIIAFDEQRAAAKAVVAESWPLTTRTGADPLVLIELVAQTAALNNGWMILQRRSANQDHRGWIVGVKSARLFIDRIAIGTTITIESRNQFEYDNFREIRGEVKIGDRVAAEVVLQLVQAEPMEKKSKG